MPMPEEIRMLVKRFDENIKEVKSASYDETTVRVEYVNKLFIALGWDVNNESGYSLAYRDVIFEANVKGKRPDYEFRIGGQVKFYVETKKPAHKLETEPQPAIQLRGYLWNAKLDIGILTDFEHFIIYESRHKPTPKDKASVDTNLSPSTSQEHQIILDQ